MRGKAESGRVLGSKESKNCVCIDGVLTTGFGMADYRTRDALLASMSALNTKIKQVLPFLYRGNGYTFGENMLVLTQDSYLYKYVPATGLFTSLGKCGSSTKMTLAMDSNNEIYAMICGNAGVWQYNRSGELVKVSDNASCGLCVWYADRLFFVDEPYALSYTAACEPTKAKKTAAECGKIEIASALGRIVALAALKNYLYVFMKRGILRMHVKDGAENFSIEEVGYDGGDIFFDGAVSGSGHILFLAADGVYLFDGSKAKRVCENMSIEPKREGQECSGVFADGYFHLQYLDKSGEKKRLCLSSDGKSGHFAFAVEGLSDGLGKGLFVYQHSVKNISMDGTLPSGEGYTFVSEPLSFGSNKRKTLKSLRLFGKGECVVQVQTENKQKSYSVCFEDGVAMLPIGMRGEQFSLAFELQKGSKITGVQADVICLKNRVR